MNHNSSKHNKVLRNMEHVQMKRMAGVEKQMNFVGLSICVVIFLASSWTVVVADVEDDYLPTSDDDYLDPCKADAFLGDIALTHREYITTWRMELEGNANSGESDFLLELLKEDMEPDSEIRQNLTEYMMQLQMEQNSLWIILRENIRRLRVACDAVDMRTCHEQKAALREEVKQTRAKWRNLTLQTRQIREYFRQYRNMTRESKETALTSDQEEEFMANSRQRRAATAQKDILWEHGVIPFVIESNFTGDDKALFRMAMKHWELNTCITFKDRDPEDRHYIFFTRRDCGCCSVVGRRSSGAQAVSIGKDCDKFGIVVHELGHAIGFWHEHTRPDRDKYVTIQDENIAPGHESNFKKWGEEEIDALGEPYDYDSIMHYSRNKFSVSTFKDTIVAHRLPGQPSRPNIGQREALSKGDIRQTNKLYNCPSCGQTLQNPSDVFGYTPEQGVPAHCQWRISVTLGETIALNVTSLVVPKTESCEEDYLEVRDGHFIGSPLLGRFCGEQQPPGPLQSTGNRMWVEYKTANGEGEGFTAGYEAVCGGVIMKEQGFIMSPNYPHSYPPNRLCVWNITMKENFTVVLHFDTFEVENHDTCSYDHLEVRDGPTESSPLVGKFCGFHFPEDIASTGRHLYVKFMSDSDIQKAGFSASFVQEYDECQTDHHGCEHVCVNTVGSYHCTCKIGYELHSDGKRCDKECGGYIVARRGRITSPSYPDLYPPNKKCVWHIRAEEGYKIKVTFIRFDVESDMRSCRFDYVRISSEVDTHWKVHGEFCGYIVPEPVISMGNSLRIEFISDGTVQRIGFKAKFRAGRYK